MKRRITLTIILTALIFTMTACSSDDEYIHIAD